MALSTLTNSRRNAPLVSRPAGNPGHQALESMVGSPEGGEADPQGPKTVRSWIPVETVETNVDLLIGETTEERVSGAHPTYPRGHRLRALIAR